MRADMLETKMVQEENIHENESKSIPTAYCILDMGQGMVSIIILNSPNYPVFAHFTI